MPRQWFNCLECGRTRANEYSECAYCGGDVVVMIDEKADMIEVVNGVVVGPVMHRVALCFNGREVAVGTVESWEEAIIWCQSEWDRRKNDLLAGEAQRIGWTNPEVRYWL